MRYIGVNLHTTNFVVCFLSEDDTSRLETYPLTKTGINRFISHLDKEDELAVEVTANIYYFHDHIKVHVSRVVLRAGESCRVRSNSRKMTCRP